MQLRSSAFEEGGKIPRKYTCQGEDINPELEISGVPAGAKSLVLIVDDPDVPEWVRKDKLWVHWVVYDIDPEATRIGERASDLGIFGKNTSGERRYMGPCPPDREHRYFFKLYALDTKLGLAPGATKSEIEKAMAGHTLAECQLMGLYQKS